MTARVARLGGKPPIDPPQPPLEIAAFVFCGSESGFDERSRALGLMKGPHAERLRVDDQGPKHRPANSRSGRRQLRFEAVVDHLAEDLILSLERILPPTQPVSLQSVPLGDVPLNVRSVSHQLLTVALGGAKHHQRLGGIRQPRPEVILKLDFAHAKCGRKSRRLGPHPLNQL